MTDIVERLRIRQPLLGTLCDEAADEIEALRTALDKALTLMKLDPMAIVAREGLAVSQENERLRAALGEIAGNKTNSRAWLEDRARRALEPKP